ncbi:beta-L-arabinofuranosidase domain-containing protein [Rhizomicrobium electricum]|uniref:Uncharacterized protein n=1 Tax=Rhizomicrobium electricum TaxID=480070 RepID=A0ABN1F9B8_9PROT|nr:beta-L-arabinofuranosidase domain-containing protein [Rhizomicrobium electricum]NIJ50675.1 hypothetical protein [Rhizomicrobium electricum]
MFEVCRRSVLKGATVATVLGGAAAKPTRHAGREVMQEFAYSDVTLTGGPLGEQYNWMKAHFLALDNDQLLKVYRQHAGLEAPGKDMGGWYDADGFVPGLTLGQYISGLARFGSTTGDAAFHAKVATLVGEFAKIIARNPNPFAGPGTEKQWAAYVYDKHAIGLIDAYDLSHVHEAADLLPRVWQGAKPFVSPISRDRNGKKDPPYDETYVLSENMFAAARVTGDNKFRALGEHYLLNKEFFDPLSKGQDVLPHAHAYSHAICLSSGAAAYLEIGDDKYKNALVNAWHFLELQRYASGGWGPEEQFVVPHTGALYKSLFSTKAHFETPCGSYANTKLARYLLRFTGDARYGDGLERDLFNTILAVRKPDNDGNYPYYSSYGPASKKEYYPRKWPCCSGTLAQCVADYPLDIYFHGPDRLYVNLYTPSQVRWLLHGQTVTLRQETDFPYADKTTLRITLARAEKFTLALRIPGWIAGKSSVLVNGEPIAIHAAAGQFALIERSWKSGDIVELTLPQNQRMLPIDDKHPDIVALMKGPVMYVSAEPTAASARHTAAPDQNLTALAPDGTPKSNGREKSFVPFHLVDQEAYDTYHKLG